MMAFIKSFLVLATLLWCANACSSLQFGKSSLAPNSAVPGYQFAVSCEWKHIGTDSGTEQNCDSLYISETLSTAERDRIAANLAAKCQNNGLYAKSKPDTCPRKTRRTCQCEGPLNLVSKNAADSQIYLRATRHWPDATEKGLENLKQSSLASELSCKCTSDVNSVSP